MIHQINEGMEDPRPSIEVREIAQWMYRNQVKRLASGEQQGRFSMMQAARGIRSGASRRKLTAEFRDRAIVQAVNEGRSLRGVGREYGLDHKAVSWILRRGV